MSLPSWQPAEGVQPGLAVGTDSWHRQGPPPACWGWGRSIISHPGWEWDPGVGSGGEFSDDVGLGHVCTLGR